ncbi:MULTISPECIES: hypothetical protein [unclassified Butyrivibrio]|uniref:hypothetical protein n=1 Tax=unclassified Butyrivibrio TaxID=2639466 RepID=UPI00040F8716|nr:MULTISPECIES: hypothetical protein [unclassified Butyrivibrio]SEL70573.1 hypothetical protein SAMN04487770_11568 [Butyrivibrio sp. ob235]
MIRKMISKVNVILATVATVSMTLSPVTALAKGNIAEDMIGTTDITWDMVTSQDGADELIDAGRFVQFDEVDCQMWIPDAMQPEELTEEDLEKGYLGYYSTEERDCVAGIVYVDVGGMTLEEYKNALSEDKDISGITDITLNGLHGIIYEIKNKDACCVSFTSDTGYVLEFTFAPMSDEGYSAVVACMIASISEQ